MRVVQISDTHLAAATGVPPTVRALIDWMTADPPDLVVHTGDIVWTDPDHDDDREFAHGVFSALPCPVVAVPGNHDVGFYDSPDERPRRLGAFTATWGADRFAFDAAGWRLVGVDAYTVGEPEADGWVADALETGAPVALFIHQPVSGEPADDWTMLESARERVGEMVAAADVRLVASGHRHCAVVRARPDEGIAGEAVHVWAPSTTLTGLETYHGGDPAPGAVEYRFRDNGTFTHRFVSPASPLG